MGKNCFVKKTVLFWVLIIGLFFLFSCTNKVEEQETSVKYNPSFPELLQFNPTEWLTNNKYKPIGDKRAIKGGDLTLLWAWPDYPPTLRGEGPNANLAALKELHNLIYESLINLHPETLEVIPGLANYWQIASDKKTFRFRINPKAKWADGSEITADDVLATWEHLVDKAIKDPYTNILFGEKFEKPVIEDKYTIKLVTKELNWRLFVEFGAYMKIYPAKYIRIPGDEYLKKYQWKFVMGSGPYELKASDLIKDKSIALTRRKDYWSEKEPMNIGLNNFDKIKWVVVRDETLQFEKFKKGEIDVYRENTARRWVQETDFDKVKKGWIQKRKIYTKKPQGFSGFVFNMRKPPFNDKRIRLAFAYLFNREKLIDQLFFKQYEFIDSYFPGSIWANPDNPKIRYNPEKASALLAEAGWSKRNSEGILVDKNNKPFEIAFDYGSQGMQRVFTVVAEDFKKAGIKLNLKLIDTRTLIKKIDERNFLLHSQAWTADIFPNPESSWMSELADKDSNNNVAGFKNKKLDELCKQYNLNFDLDERIKLIREIDKIIFNEHPYALGWYANYTRILYFNKFGYPATYFKKTLEGDERDAKQLWWYDSEKEKALNEAMKNNKTLPVGEVIVKPWG